MRPPPFFAPDSRLVNLVRPCLGYTTSSFARRPGKVHACTLHTMGAGLVRRWQRQGPRFHEGSPFETALRVYGRLMKPSAHYAISQGGTIAQLAPERVVAWHVGADDSAGYRKTPDAWGDPRKHRWWHERWKGLRSPADLAWGCAWEGGSHNDVSIGIEMTPPVEDPTGPWSARAWQALAELVVDICRRHAMAPADVVVLTHSDVHPRARSDGKGRPWDPGPRQYAGFEDFAERAGLRRPPTPDTGA